MSTILILLALAALVAVLFSWARGFRRGSLFAATNTLPANVGRSRYTRRYKASAAVATRFLLCKKGADDEHAAAVAAASDEPIGAFTDEPAAAEDPTDVALFGISPSTLPLVAAAAITMGAEVYSDGTGKVTIKPTAAGTYWRVGTALTAATADGDPVEVLPIKPRKLIVVSALESTNGTAAGAADLAALKAETEKLGDDLRKIAAALDGNADVALATT